MEIDWAGKVVLITGGTGSFGNCLVRLMLADHPPQKLIIFSRDELKQFDMSRRFEHPCLRFFIGDVRDRNRLHRAFDGVDIIIHAAAMKQVPASEYNPFEAVQTNILGAQNIVDEAIDSGVERVIALSSDKAANPVNLYGATKLCSDKLFVAANSYAGKRKTRFSVVRYGNVIGSRGSVVPLFEKMKQDGMLRLTDERMTRFWITLPQAARFVIRCAGTMQGGEIFVPRIPSMKLVDLARAIAPDCKIVYDGIRPGEKLHEVMIPVDDARHARFMGDHYIIEPEFAWWGGEKRDEGKPLPDDFRYSSENNDWWLTDDDLMKLIAEAGDSESTE